MDNLRIYYQLALLDASGRVVRRLRRRRAHSLVLQFLQHHRTLVNDSGESPVVDTGGTSRTLQATSTAAASYMALEGESGVNRGLVVGSGSTAVAMTDSALATLITSGVGAGQLTYSSQTVQAITGSGSSRSYTVVRTFVNSSGGTVTVRECGAYCQSDDSGGTARTFLLWRDVLSPAVDVPDGQSLALTYTITISV